MITTKKNYKTIFFDLDDTLIDTFKNTTEAVEEIYEKNDLKKYFESFNEFHQIYRANNNKLWDSYSKGAITKEELTHRRFIEPLASIKGISSEQALRMNEDYLLCVGDKSGLIDDAIIILKYLQPKYQLHIISNGFTELQYRKMDASGISTYFKQVILSDETGANKPAPAIFTYALNVTGANKDSSIMIGDSYNSDIIGAQNSDIDQIWYNPGQIKPLQAPATYTINRLKDILNIL